MRWSTLVVTLAGVCVVGTSLHAQDRRERTTPGLVLNTGARHAPCDALLFSPIGDELLAAGDDKVVRAWPVRSDALDVENSRVLRWPTFREQRGGIYAMGLSPDARRVAITGHGVKTGLVVVLDRKDGSFAHVLADPPRALVNWAVAWSPDGKHVVYGNDAGEVFRWTLATNAVTRFAGKAVGGNRVRAIRFLDGRHFVTVTRDGKVWKHDAEDPAAAPVAVAQCKRSNLVAAVVAPTTWRLAVCAENYPGEVEVLDLSRGVGAPLHLPMDPAWERFPFALAFDDAGDRLLVGTRDALLPGRGEKPFNRSAGGRAFAFDLSGEKPRLLTSEKGLDAGYTVDAVAFRPGHPDQIATAGGPNQEVRLWRLDRDTPLAEVRGPGSSIWAVRMDAKGKYLAWREQVNERPSTPNDRGAGPWRYFRLDREERHILPRPPADFQAEEPLAECAGWRVETTPDSYVWEVVTPRGRVIELTEASGLYLKAMHQVPRCYTFLPARGGKPVRLAIGHMWGVSVYELADEAVKLARVLVGHEGEVMAVAPAANGTLLLTAGRDQTVACWSLEPWDYQRELGASFTTRGGQLLVGQVKPGSPAWEAGLTDSDEVLVVFSQDRKGTGGFVYNPTGRDLAKLGIVRVPGIKDIDRAAVLDELRERVEPAREYIFVWKHGGRELSALTSVRQRPLWRFFPTREEAGGDWVLWRWRDYHYDTLSPQADRLVGWQMHARNLLSPPTFHPLARVGGFHDPARVWKTIRQAFNEPDTVLLPDIEPPRIAPLRVAQAPTPGQPLKVAVSIAPFDATAEGQKLGRIVVWLDDTRFDHDLTPDAKGVVSATLTVPGAQLRQGRNRVKVVCFNAKGARAEQALDVDYQDTARKRGSLYGLCVGINDYSRVTAGGARAGVSSLRFAGPDAEVIKAVLDQQAGSRLYDRSEVTLLPAARATAAEIKARLEALGKKVGRDDWLVLFLSGHGVATHEPGSFRYLCVDSDVNKPATGLQADEIHRILGDIPCRKLILLDTCRSGSVASSPIRDLNKDGVEFRIFSACKPHQDAIEPTPAALARQGKLDPHGLFTQALLGALGKPEAGRRGRPEPMTDRELADAIRREMRALLSLVEQPPTAQEPEFYPRREEMSGLPVLSRVGGK